MKWNLYCSRQRRLIILFVLALLLATAVYRQAAAGNAPSPAATTGDAAAAVAFWQARVNQNPQDPAAHAQLGLSYLQQVRESDDPTLYAPAEAALNAALALEPEYLDALVGHGILALARHDFEGALRWGEEARAVNPYRAQILGILVDANVELGRYEEAVATAQAMVDLRPDLASYSRVSYLRELHGDVEGAIAAMTTAVSAGAPGSEQMAWAQTHLGDIYLENGRLSEAEAVYEETLHFRPNYSHALAGLAQIRAAQGEYKAAIEIVEPLVERLPVAEFAMLLGDLYTQTGNLAEAEHNYDMVRSIQAQHAAVDVGVDLEMALFEADHGDTRQAVAMARVAYSQQPNIYAADALAWALYQNGQFEKAWPYSQEALQLGTSDATLYYHAGLIARALGEETAAQEYLDKAEAINPSLAAPNNRAQDQ